MAKDVTSENMVLRTVYLPKALDKQLRTIAFEAELSKGELMRVLIAEAMQRRAAKGEAAFGKAAGGSPSTKAPSVVRAKSKPVAVAPAPAPPPIVDAEPVKVVKPRTPPKPVAESKPAAEIQQSSIFDFL